MEEKGEFSQSSSTHIPRLEGNCSGPDHGSLESTQCNSMNPGIQSVSEGSCVSTE